MLEENPFLLYDIEYCSILWNQQIFLYGNWFVYNENRFTTIMILIYIACDYNWPLAAHNSFLPNGKKDLISSQFIITGRQDDS